jgi:hypothetical protein
VSNEVGKQRETVLGYYAALGQTALRLNEVEGALEGIFECNELLQFCLRHVGQIDQEQQGSISHSVSSIIQHAD